MGLNRVFAISEPILPFYQVGQAIVRLPAILEEEVTEEEMVESNQKATSAKIDIKRRQQVVENGERREKARLSALSALP